MLRSLLTPRWAGLSVLLLLVVAACVLLGRWQWHQARAEVVRNPPPGTASFVDVHTLGQPVDPDEAGRRVWLRGAFDAEREVTVVDRYSSGSPGSWVVTAMRVDGSPGLDVPVVPVVRGWVPGGIEPPPPPEGQQRIVGWLEPSEPDALRKPGRGPLPDGKVEVVSSPELLSLWQPPLYQGFVIQQVPTPQEPLVQVEPPDRVQVVTDWQNAAYAVQWWLFGLFAIFWFGRMVRLDAEDRESPPGEGRPSGLGRMDSRNEAPGEKGST